MRPSIKDRCSYCRHRFPNRAFHPNFIESKRWSRPEFVAILSLLAAILSLIVALPSALTAIDDLSTKDAPPKITVTLDYYYKDGLYEKIMIIWDVSTTPNRFYINDSNTIIKVDGEKSGVNGGIDLPFLFDTIETGRYKRDGEFYVPSERKIGGHKASIDFWMSIKDLDNGKIYEGILQSPFILTPESPQSNNEPKRIVFSEIKRKD